MDWLDEQLERIYKRKEKLLPMFIFHVLLGSGAAVCLYLVTVSLCVSWERLLLNEYEPLNSLYEVFNQPYILDTTELPTAIRFPVEVLQIFRRISLVIYLIIGVVWSGSRFFKHKIQQPLLLMNETIKGIQTNDFDIPCYYDSDDEFAQVCLALEVLRQQLLDERGQSLQSQKEQRQVNAAFAHDLRTPLAVVQSNLELVQTFYPKGKMTEEQLLQALQAATRHIQQLNTFTFTMQEIQKIDELQMIKRICSTKELLQMIGEIGQTVADKEVLLRVEESVPESLNYDSQLTARIIANLFSNAERFAKHKIEVTLQVDGQYLMLFMQDDGEGFSKEELKKAVSPYYSRDKSQHFGMGLTICQALSKKHGGLLRLSNAVNGGAIISITLSML